MALFRMDSIIKVFLLVTLYYASVACQSCNSPTDRCDCFQENGRQIINCRYKNLTQIPTFTNNGLIYDEIRFTQIDYAGSVYCNSRGDCNNITQLGPDAFVNLKVRKIDLQKNSIVSVDNDAFRGLEPILEAVSIEGAGSDMPYSALSLLDEQLKSLHLVNYGHRIIVDPIVLPYPNLQSLTLENWRNLHTIDANVFNIMKNLTELKLLNLLSLTTLPVAAIQKFLKLTNLDIRDTGIRNIDGDSFTPMSMLHDVKIINNNNLQTIDHRAFSSVTRTVVYLDLDYNQLENLEFLRYETWSVISHLNIGYNRNLRTLPAGIFSKMPTLDYLLCQDIRLVSINKEMFTGLSQLHTLDLAYNEIETISTEAFKNTPALVDLRLLEQYEGTIDFQANAFNGIETALEILALNKLKFDLPQFWSDLSKLSNLKVLEMVNTGVDRIPDRAFRNNTELTTILMSDNNLTSVSQETFYGPRYTLRTIDLRNNQIRTVDMCTLEDFPTKPKITLAGNKLKCDCDLVWLYDWFKQQNNQDLVANEIGSCTEPASLADKYFSEFTRSQMCPGGTSVRTCPDLYATTTTVSTTTTTTTTTTPPITTPPVPDFEVLIVNRDSTTIEISWIINDRTHVSALKLELISNVEGKKLYYPGTDAQSFTIYRLLPDTSYTVCLILKIENDYRDEKPDCRSVVTLPPVTVPSSTTETTPESDSQLGVIIGAAVGGVVLVGLIIAILVVLLRANKPKKAPKPLPEPVSFTMKADIPHAGGTARRFAKKADKEGATPDDINITVISNGEMTNKDRISAGSYQALNEKGVDKRPMPSSPGHYANSWEERPLPKAPYRSDGATGHGYVNDGFKNSAERLPETSKNQYSEVRY